MKMIISKTKTCVSAFKKEGKKKGVPEYVNCEYPIKGASTGYVLWLI